MRAFVHLTPADLPAALGALDEDWRTRILAGGTDLLTEMKAGLVQPERVLDVKPLAALRGIVYDPQRGLRLGALVTLGELAHRTLVRERYTALSQAAELAASPQLRNMATLGGNLCQSSRCWYYRGGFPCYLRGGAACPAEQGENPYHAVLDGGPCHTVQPSDLATALVALDATVHLHGPQGERVLPIEQFLTRPEPDHWRLNALGPREVLAEVRIAASAEAGRSVFLKAMERASWDFALASVALWVRVAGDTIRAARLVLGGVATVPWRAREAETLLVGARANPAAARAAAAAALSSARPLKDNAYKVGLARGLVRRAVLELR
ncbi:MAG: xanthine dehydrogenase family protein subunit M [Chloroflexi bacterium]|nr:xanthine dehydrogenase family protein subunit M [Chloroflexota bacterium]